MRGNPAGQLVLIILVFLALGVPVWRLTQPAAPATASTVPEPAGTGAAAPIPVGGTTPLDVTLDFAPAAAEFSLGYLDQTILQGKAQSSAAGPWKVALPREGADLVLHAAWPVGSGVATAAARVTFRFPGGRTVEKSVWSPGGGTLDTVVTVADPKELHQP